MFTTICLCVLLPTQNLNSLIVFRVSTNLITRNNNARFVIIAGCVWQGRLDLSLVLELLELALSSFGDEDGDGATPGEGFGAGQGEGFGSARGVNLGVARGLGGDLQGLWGYNTMDYGGSGGRQDRLFEYRHSNGRNGWTCQIGGDRCSWVWPSGNGNSQSLVVSP